MRIHSFDGTNRFRKAARRLHPKVKKELIDLSMNLKGENYHQAGSLRN